MRNSVFGGSTVSNSSRNTDTIRSGASSSTTGASSLWSGYMASSTAASSTYSDTEDSPVMVQRDPSYEEVHSRGVLPTPTKVRSKISSPPSAIPKHVAQDESLMRARNFGSHSSISQLLNDPPLLPQSSSEESMGKSHSANELYTSMRCHNHQLWVTLIVNLQVNPPQIPRTGVDGRLACHRKPRHLSLKSQSPRAIVNQYLPLATVSVRAHLQAHLMSLSHRQLLEIQSERWIRTSLCPCTPRRVQCRVCQSPCPSQTHSSRQTKGDVLLQAETDGYLYRTAQHQCLLLRLKTITIRPR